MADTSLNEGSPPSKMPRLDAADDTAGMSGDTSTMSEDTAVKSGDTSTMSADTAVKSGDTSAMSGDAAVKSGDTSAMSGDAAVKAGDTSAMSGDATFMLEDTVAVMGDSSAMSGETAGTSEDTSTADLDNSVIVMGEEPGVLGTVSVQRALDGIEDCQCRIEELNDKATEEILAVETKYVKLRRPHFERRNELIAGIDSFWVTAILNHPSLANLVDEDEEDCLNYLTQVDIEEFADLRAGFAIHFHFKSNPYFTNDVLTKSFFHTSTGGQPRSRCSEIRWKREKSRINRLQLSTSRAAKSGRRCFFSWYLQYTDPARDRIVKMLKEEIWVNPLKYYLAGEENGITGTSDDDEDSVVIVGDDSDESDGDSVYEVEGGVESGSEGPSGSNMEDTVESIQVDDDTDDSDSDAVQVLDSESEPEVHEISPVKPGAAKLSPSKPGPAKPAPSKPGPWSRGKVSAKKPSELDSINSVVAAAMLDFAQVGQVGDRAGDTEGPSHDTEGVTVPGAEADIQGITPVQQEKGSDIAAKGVENNKDKQQVNIVDKDAASDGSKEGVNKVSEKSDIGGSLETNNGPGDDAGKGGGTRNGQVEGNLGTGKGVD
ncbi:putative testis-specific Y-encoded-like protein 3 [Mya arenaria]|uniref:putative testis-specific Y-encoded-like protein 3 n=1 Tax=Mya arenaria TaxID=6604 RepID=UPI0022E149C9|nr:putative testis-specific Y-encoded-like protein 3 [Mya arenaria]XP_052782059.1 putative testis-specific Y-encoded-like protein 3 [Mya arenaria]XP_052782060.1 putative testis-specific Y-encoded-like protein 3 [Mya arenaria]